MRVLFFLVLIFLSHASMPVTSAQGIDYATTTLSISICGNALVDAGEQCDVPGETGVYSQTIAGRQCTPICQFGPYCGDGILQTVHNEECDDGNNESGDFCSATCTIEPAGSGGGGSSGGGSSGGGGSSTELGDTLISITGRAYPSRTINFLLDTENVGSVRTDGDGEFDFSTEASPGTATLGIWAEDGNGNRSITLNNTFDVTQGAITNLNNVILPPTVAVSSQNIDPGAQITLTGASVPDSEIEVHFNEGEIIETATAGGNGNWSLTFDTGRLSIAEHTVRARSVVGNPPLTTESGFSSTLQLFVGVDGQPSTPSDLNRDGSVNLIDFSILIFWWGTNGGDSDPPADINQNGQVSLEDFSILLFNWTG
jgi:cysteine-rich repeat protein